MRVGLSSGNHVESTYFVALVGLNSERISLARLALTF